MQPLLELTLIKKHLNIDELFTSDDEYLLQLLDVAQESLKHHLNVSSLEEVFEADEYEGHKHCPTPLLHWILLFIGTLYSNRESIAPIQMYELPKSDYLLTPYKHYSIL